MTRKQIVILAALGVFVILVLALGFLTNRGGVLPNGYSPENSLPGVLNPSATGTAGVYSSEVSKDAVLTVPKNEAPASANPNLDTQIKFFDMKAAKTGFTPDSITVNKGDNLQIDFTAVDGDYDLNIPYLGAYFSAVKRGATKRLIFDTSLPGTFLFECRDHCPSGGKIQGMLIVLP
ncbi:MAG: hypothetical protein UY23_C0001G0320 [Candidatus Jorgensenbacteria bacterium GW2011_GWA1_48_11]|uniref:Uncharacterized protein n=1 Tax=Candidatus Jorgensenbacteria bacterium GW2011_GWA1_48_11 TaxID=1618660 RepID=A0A0G1UC76_9BACT|nr:MAG: hypothetical protein UY23_C0001G0320 [Candidatus Jorgensenbacteria bacterium GW2011_GWA1_48_11]KKW12205.1 MAG: hypothetical protein UY51_C0005G0447 [Candidatus Jorgensenbacteria bacterium GW2011_GWB1_49_9]